MDPQTSQLAGRFSSLSTLGKLEFLTRLAHEETVCIRIGFLGKSAQVEPIKKSNEHIHHICNYNLQILEVNRYLSDADIMESLVELFGEQEGGLDRLIRTFDEIRNIN